MLFSTRAIGPRRRMAARRRPVGSIAVPENGRNRRVLVIPESQAERRLTPSKQLLAGERDRTPARFPARCVALAHPTRSSVLAAVSSSAVVRQRAPETGPPGGFTDLATGAYAHRSRNRRFEIQLPPAERIVQTNSFSAVQPTSLILGLAVARPADGGKVRPRASSWPRFRCGSAHALGSHSWRTSLSTEICEPIGWLQSHIRYLLPAT